MPIFQETESRLGKTPSERSMPEYLRYGIAVIDKPIGPSSHEVASFVKKILHLRIVGHTGTLDENVSGVLVVLLEETRKAAGYIARSDKKYICIMRLAKEAERQDLEDGFSHFRGEIYQRPPLQSAVAKRLRVRKIHSLNILEIRGKEVLFECGCEAGTYIRKLVFDMGEVLGVRAEMAELRRTEADGLAEGKAITLQKLSDYYWVYVEKGDESHLRNAVLPVEALEMKRISIADEAAKRIKHGIKPKIGDLVKADERIAPFDKIGIFTGKGELIAMGEALFGSEAMKRAAEDGKADQIAARISRVIHEF